MRKHTIFMCASPTCEKRKFSLLYSHTLGRSLFLSLSPSASLFLSLSLLGRLKIYAKPV